MNKKIEVSTEEVKKVYLLSEDLNDFFHRKENYPGIENFAHQNYRRIHECYYDIVWNWLPKDVKGDILNR